MFRICGGYVLDMRHYTGVGNYNRKMLSYRT
jgi:hypothetical protein